MKIAVDFDGTIVEPKWPEIGREKFGARWVLNWAARRGHTLMLWTCREGVALDDAKTWLKQQGIWDFSYFNESTPEDIATYDNDSRKIGFDILIDDKAGLILWPLQFVRILLAEWRYGR